MTFAEALKIGQTGESIISKWIQRKGFSVMPVYEESYNKYKGPMVFTTSGGLVAPDMFVFNDKRAFWIEAKNKSAFSWYRKKERWTTGIDTRHFNDYVSIAESSSIPILLTFIQHNGIAKGDEVQGPTGLYWHTVRWLKTHMSHTHDSPPMIYWAEKTLKFVCTLEQLMETD